MVIGMEVRANAVGSSHSNTRVGKEVQPLPSVGMKVPCPYTKEKTGEAVAVEKAAEWGMTCLEETCFKIFSDGLGFESKLLGSQWLGEAPSLKDMGLAQSKSSGGFSKYGSTPSFLKLYNGGALALRSLCTSNVSHSHNKQMGLEKVGNFLELEKVTILNIVVD